MAMAEETRFAGKALPVLTGTDRFFAGWPDAGRLAGLWLEGLRPQEACPRGVAPDEAGAVLEHLRALSREARMSRFGGTPADRFLEALADEVAAGRLRAIAWADTSVADAGAEAADLPRFVGLVVYPDPATVAGPALEVGISVVDAAQGRGIGAALLLAVARDAAASGKPHLLVATQMRNRAMVRLASALGGRVIEQEGSEISFEIDVEACIAAARPTAVSRSRRTIRGTHAEMPAWKLPSSTAKREWLTAPFLPAAAWVAFWRGVAAA